MDLLTHISAGMAVGALVACSQTDFKKQAKLIALGGLGGALPDVDTISLWSHFDSSFGALFHLQQSGKTIYGAKFWYSHHAFLHSLVAALLWASIPFLYQMIRKIANIGKGANDYVSYLAFIGGYTLHLLCDMPTPASVWGGVNLFWPSVSYVGGTGQIWWWNNYDIFLLMNVCLLSLITIFLIAKQTALASMRYGAIVFALFAIAVFYQINTRNYDYQYHGNSTNFTEMEAHSKKEQERILGKTIYSWMVRFDRLVILHF